MKNFMYQLDNQILGKNITINQTLTVANGEPLEIRDSILDFSKLTGITELITNQGQLLIINSTIISDLQEIIV